mmetsp:Transcript_113711/g.321564  ORF Transcript_113711/g.321564 Transcript_113711/m.321564 type:complete len:243 (-) Transcript_113711:269-997(-)
MVLRGVERGWSPLCAATFGQGRRRPRCIRSRGVWGRRDEVDAARFGPLRHDSLGEERVRVWALRRFLAQQAQRQLPRLAAMQIRVQGFRVPGDDLHRQRRQAPGLEGQLHRQHLVKYNTDRPNICLGVVRIAVADLRRHMARRTDNGVRHSLAMPEGPSNAEVAKLHKPIARQENILTLDVAVDNELRVNVLQRLRALRKDGERLPLGESAALRLPPTDDSSEVAALGVLHDDAQSRVHEKR